MTDQLKTKATEVRTKLLVAADMLLDQASRPVSASSVLDLIKTAAASAHAAAALGAIVDPPNPGVARGIVDPPPDPGYVPTDPPPDPGRK